MRRGQRVAEAKAGSARDAAELLKVRYALDPADKVLKAYLEDEHRVVGIMGPRNSAKSSASIIKLYRNALGQPAGDDGWIKRRTVVVRRTYAELLHTTIPSWKNWLPSAVFGEIPLSLKPIVRRSLIPPLDWEVIFIALDRAEDVRFLNSMEVSDSWVNEAWEVAREIISGLVLTTNRYPNPMSKEGCYRPQVLWDTNGPPLGHWIGYMSGLEAPHEREVAKYRLPETWAIHIQPPGVLPVRDDAGETIGWVDNPDAENSRHRSPSYYQDAVAGATPDIIQRYLVGRPGGVTSGAPVWPHFRMDVHVSKQPLRITPGFPIIVGMDFGRTPAAVVCQELFGESWRIIAELDGVSTGAKEFAEDYLLPLLGRLVAEVDPDQREEWETVIYGDPAGEHESEALNDATPIRMLRAAVGSVARVVPAWSAHKFPPRRDSMNLLMKRLTGAGGPALLISPACKSLLRSAQGAYCYDTTKRISTGETITEPRPNKRNPATHIANALEYAIVGHDKGALIMTPAAGGQIESRRSLGYFARVESERREARKPFVASRGGSFFQRRKVR